MAKRVFYTVSSLSRLNQAFLLAKQIESKSLNSGYTPKLFIFLSEKITLKIKQKQFDLFEKLNIDIDIITFDVFLKLNIEKHLKKRTVIEKTVMFKALALNYLFLYGTDNATYIDTDIYLLKLVNIDPEEEWLLKITPHTTNIYSSYLPILLRDGAYNTGYFSVNFKNHQIEKFLNFFTNYCLAYCYEDRNLGLFYEQKSFDLLFCFFDDIDVIKAYNSNLGYWNIDDNKFNYLTNKINTDEFIHFSGFEVKTFKKLSVHINTNNPITNITPALFHSIIEYWRLMKIANAKKSNLESFVYNINVIDKANFNYKYLNQHLFHDDFYHRFNYSPKNQIIKKILKILNKSKLIKNFCRAIIDQRVIKNL